MSRYIDADALMDSFAELTVDLWLDSVEEAEIASLIGNAPSIDIVRCGECKLGGTEDCPMDEIYSENFCSYGERKEQ